MDTVDGRKRFFDDEALNAIAWVWGDAVRFDERLTGFWFETDVRQDLLTPRRYYAFHISVRDESFDDFVADRESFVVKAGALQTHSAQVLVWPYARTYSGKKVPKMSGACLRVG